MIIIENGKSAEVIANLINKITTSSTSNPTATDDISKNYFVGSKWVNTTTKIEFTCIDNTSGAAIWSIATPDIATQAEAEAGTDNKKVMTPLRVFQAIAKWITTKAIGKVESFTNTKITANDTIPVSLGKLQGQIDNKQKSISRGTGTPSGGSDGDIYIQYFN